MNARSTLMLIISLALNLPLLAQTDFEHSLTRHKSNKIVLPS
jgi:hypothetical protein